MIPCYYFQIAEMPDKFFVPSSFSNFHPCSAGQEDYETLAMAVSRVFLAEKSGDAAAMELYELLGDSALEHISELMENRK